MVGRLINISTKQSFFLFGARGTGKTSLVKSYFQIEESGSSRVRYIDLLNLDTEARYQLNPESLYAELTEAKSTLTTVVIDEIQKTPRLLDVVHRKIEESKIQFVMTGSSARKLKAGGANLLAGRAVVFDLFPLLAAELGRDFNLEHVLAYGALPLVVNTADQVDKKRILTAYANTYLKEEVWGEQLVRKIEPFRRFLQVAAQTHGQPVNYSKISRDVGVDDSTVRSYFSILEDTLLGFYLPAYAGSERQKLRKTPKFYLFDNGVKRALDGSIDFLPKFGTFEYGVLFEQFVITEIMRLASYRELHLGFSYFATEGGVEIDLVIERVGKVVALIEIKSGSKVDPRDLSHLKGVGPDFHGAQCLCLYNGKVAYRDGAIRVLPWQDGIAEVFGAI